MSKFILLALLLNLACLIMLLVQQKSGTNVQDRASQAGAEAGWESPPEETAVGNNLSSPSRLNFSSSAAIPGPNRMNGRAAYPVPNDAHRETAASPPPRPLPFDATPGVVVPVSATIASGAEVGGRVWLIGTPPSEMAIAMDAMCGRLQTNPVTTRHYLVTEDGRLGNVFVWIKNGLENARYPAETNRPVLDNVGCLFEPYVMGLQAGQRFHIRNSDPILHNVHATAQVNREFNTGLPVKGMVVEKSFPLPEVFVRIKCDVHPWMFAYIGVVPHPYFAVTDQEGVFHFPRNLPLGRYTLAARHLKAGELTQELVVRTGGPQIIEFTFRVPGS